MTAPVSRAVMSLAICCMGESRREWALAMQAEFEAAIGKGERFAFALLSFGGTRPASLPASGHL